MGRWSTRKHLCVVRVRRGERLSELSVVETAITVFVMFLEEQVHVVDGDVHSNVLQAMVDIEDRNAAEVVDVEDAEGVVSVEIGTSNCLVLGHLNLTIKIDLLSKHSDDASFSLLSNWSIKAPRLHIVRVCGCRA